MEKMCSDKQAMVIGKIFTPYSSSFINWATKNLTSKQASPFVEKLLNKTLNPNFHNFDDIKKLYKECQIELEQLGFTEEMKEKYSPFNV